MSERSIFLQALEITDESKRSEYLDLVCPQGSELRRQIEQLLAAEAQLGNFLNEPCLNLAPTHDFTSSPNRPGDFVGPYRLMEQIGEGGFGLVYVAEQQEPVRRKVAIKVIKPGMDSREIVARFEAERQAIALMDHPNIARVFDAGTTESGRPYFVMELVKGMPITEYCDVHNMPPRQRLALFVDVCRAVQHAHQKGVIHRDLKPSNILVAPYDGIPVVKVIDFGVAKALGQQLTDRTIYTRFAQMIGTPLYMSPEQAEINALDVDTRSDVYSLGVLLYELLTGTTPFDRSRLASAAFDEIRRIIKEEQPAKPSTRVSSLGESLPSVSSRRNLEPRQLAQCLQGDLDVIVMKALEKERARRYETANSLADDVSRYLNQEPIIARPASVTYRFRKFVQRNRVALAFFCSIVALLLFGIAVSTALAIREVRARQLAIESLQAAREQQQLALAAKHEAELQRDRAESAQLEEAKQRQRAQERELDAESAKEAEAAERTAAEAARDKVRTLNATLASQEKTQRRLLYAAQMNMIRSAWDADNVDRVRELLNATRPRPGQDDLRGIEWHYWQGQLHAEEKMVRLERPNTGASRLPLQHVRFSEDGKLLGAVDRLTMGTVDGSPSTHHFQVLLWDSETGQLLSEKILDDDTADTTRSAMPSSAISKPHICFVDSKQVAFVTDVPNNHSSLETLGSSARGSSAKEIELKVFDIAEGTVGFSKRIRYHASSISNSPFQFSFDGSRFAAALDEPVVQVWDANSGDEIAKIDIPLRDSQRYAGARIAISPNGKRVAIHPIESESNPVGITIVDVSGKVQVGTQPVMVSHLSFTDDGNRLVVLGSQPTRSRMFDAITGEEQVVNRDRTEAFTEPIQVPAERELKFSHDGQQLAVLAFRPKIDEVTNIARTNAKILLFDTATCRVLREFKGATAPFAEVAFHEHQARLLSVHVDGTICFWPTNDVAHDADVSTAGSAQSHITKRARSADGRWLIGEPGASPAALAEGTGPHVLRLTDTEGKIPERKIPTAGPFSIPYFSPNGEFAVVISVNEREDSSTATEFKIWNLVENRELVVRRFPARKKGRGFQTLSGHMSRPTFSQDSSQVAIFVGSQVNIKETPTAVLHAWNLRTGLSLTTKPLPRKLNNLQVEMFGDLIVCMPMRFNADRNGFVGIGDERIPSHQLGTEVWRTNPDQIVWSDEESRIGWIGHDHGMIAGAKLNPTECELTFRKIENGELISTARHQRSATSLAGAFLSNGKLFFLADEHTGCVFDTSTGKAMALQGRHSTQVSAVGYSSDCQRIATTADVSEIRSSLVVPEEIKLWDAVTGQELLRLPGFRQRIPEWRPTNNLPEIAIHHDRLEVNHRPVFKLRPLSIDLQCLEFLTWWDSLTSNNALRSAEEFEQYLVADQSLDQAARDAILIALRPRFALFEFVQAKDAVKLGDVEAAIASFGKAIAFDPQYSALYHHRGDLYIQLGEFEKAVADFSTTVKLSPESFSGYQRRSIALLWSGRFDEALADANKAISLNEGLGYLYASRAYIWSAKKERNKMLSDLAEATRLGPKHALVWNYRAWLLATSPFEEQRDGAEAVSAATTACELTGWLDPSNLDALAAANAEIGNFKEAIKLQRRVIEIGKMPELMYFKERLALYQDGKPYREPIIQDQNSSRSHR